MTTTTDMSDFGSVGRDELIRILQAWENNGLPRGFDPEGVVPMMNKNSGYVFLTNAEFQVAMLRDGSLELFHSLPDSVIEGFIMDLIDEPNLSEVDQEYVNDWLGIEVTNDRNIQS